MGPPNVAPRPPMEPAAGQIDRATLIRMGVAALLGALSVLGVKGAVSDEAPTVQVACPPCPPERAPGHTVPWTDAGPR